LRQASRINTAQYLQSEGNNLASFLYYLKNNYEKEYKRIVSYVNMILPHFGDFYLEPENDYVRLNWKDDSGNDYVFSPDQFSDGSIRFIALATLLLQPEKTMPRMIIIDEPELGLHPYAIEQLIQMIKDASVHSQVIIATQSPQLIDGFSLDSIVVLEQDDETKSTVAHKLDKERLKEWIEEYTISELWRKNVIGGQPL
jgi:predicted ATPase